MMVEGARWHALPAEALPDRLSTAMDRGLDAEEARRRLAADGPNTIRRAERISAAALFAAQFSSLVVWVLVGAAVVSALLGERIDAAAILAIVLLNAAIGFFQEYRAGRALEALARMTAPNARVVRDGHSTIVPAADIVRGDVLLLEGGDLVAADARLVEAASLHANEAPLTGESAPAKKRAEVLPPETPLADRRNLVHLGTSITGGTGRAVVVATGMASEVGKIASLLETATSDETPLKKRLDVVARRLLWACLAIVAVMFLVGSLRSIPPFELFLSAVSLAVAAIPEGLPAVVTIALALGVSRMARRSALVRRLPAIETLGSAEVICTDKTGTLTVGEMTVRKIVTSDRIFGVTGEGYVPRGAILVDGSDADARADAPLRALLAAGAACNDAELAERDGRPAIVGDPTEAALLVAAAKLDVRRADVERRWPRAGAIPFDSERKRMTVLRIVEGERHAFVKGAPETILDRCAAIRTTTGDRPLSAEDRARMLEAAALLANDALRVLALAERRVPAEAAEDGEAIERELVFLGLVGMQDPPRAEVRDAVAKCKRAGIRVVMITGDHPDTARAIAAEIGILDPGDRAMTGAEIDATSDAELAGQAPRVSVYARVTAEHKLRIVRAWKSLGKVVAMTGDGVNDAPALKEASIGIAMGVTGTEVTKETADVVIADDNFASIVAAVEEGRGIYDNIAKTLAYLLAGNAGELATMLVAVVFGLPLPLLPVQLLWINLVTDGLPALALATDPIDAEVLTRPPRPRDAELIDRKFLTRLAFVGSMTAAISLLAFGYELWIGDGIEDARNAAFSVLVVAELLRSLGARSETKTIVELGLFSNLRLFWIVALSFALQLVIHHVPVLETVFGTRPISAAQCVAWFVLGALPMLVIEARKRAARVELHEVSAGTCTSDGSG